jgi:hypothetical protein
MPRWVILCAIALVSAGTAAVIRTGHSDQSPHDTAIRREITLIYVGAADCAPCRAWKRGAGAEFRASSEFAKISYREVESPSALDLLKDEYWPEDLRHYRDRLPRDAGVPLWLIVANHGLVEQQFGESQWNSAVLPALKALLQ